MDHIICFNCGFSFDRPGEPCPACGISEMTADSPKLQQLLSSGFALLRESKFAKAKKVFEDVLKKDCENAFAYFGRLRARYRISYTRAVGDRAVPRPASRSAAHLESDIDYRWANFYGDREMSAFLKAEAEYLKVLCNAPDVGASKNITHHFTMGEVDPNDEAKVKRKKPTYILKLEKATDGTYKVTGIECPNPTETKIVIPSEYEGKAVTGIDNEAFADRTALTDIFILADVRDIAEDAFFGCSSLRNITVHGSNARFCSEDGILFYKDKTKLIRYPEGKTESSYSIPESVTCIGNEAFRNCGNLTSVIIPEGVTSIGDWAFIWCSGLTDVTVPKGVTSIGRGAFANCGSLTDMTVPESVTSIGDSAFYGCSRLTRMTVPESVRTIEREAFGDCTALTSLFIPAGVTEMGEDVFFGCSNLTAIQVHGDSRSFCAEDGVLFNKEKTELICYPAGKTAASYAIPDGVTDIAASAFYGCSHLTDIAVPEGVTVIGDSAFYECGCLTSLKLPEGLTGIDGSAFSRCAMLTDVTLPSSITEIGNSAFSYCRALTSIVFGGTRAQWSAIEFGKNWNKETGYYTVKCANGTVSKMKFHPAGN